MLLRVMRSFIDRARTASPQNSTASYCPPSMPKRVHMYSIMSLAHTPEGRRPVHSMAMVWGTRSQISPLTATPSISVAPMPNM